MGRRRPPTRKNVIERYCFPQRCRITGHSDRLRQQPGNCRPTAALELGKRRGNSDPVQRPVIHSSSDVYRIFYPLLCDLPHEELWIALTNRSSLVIEKVKISQGGISETSADLRIILKAAINALAAGIILCHNHPSGNPRPSRQDDLLTQHLRDAARLLEIQLLDHIVLADGSYYSYSDEGTL